MGIQFIRQMEVTGIQLHLSNAVCIGVKLAMAAGARDEAWRVQSGVLDSYSLN